MVSPEPSAGLSAGQPRRPDVVAGPGRVPRQRLYEQIVHQLLEHIRGAGLVPGDRLPPERELAVNLGVSRASLAQALVALEVLGTVSVRHGEGAVIVERPDERQLLAAERRTETDLRRIDEALGLMEDDITGGGRGVAGDEAFHAAVTEAGHSALLARLMEETSALIRNTRLGSPAQPEHPAASLAGHRRIAAAIRDRDPRAAAGAMEDHIRLVSDVAILRQEPL